MATHKIPNEYGQIRQLNLSDTSGELVASKNIDLKTKEGKLKLAKPFIRVREGEFATHGDDVEAFLLAFDDAWYLTDEGLYRSTASNYRTWNRFTDDITAGEDLEFFDGQMVWVDGTDMNAWNGDTPFGSNDSPDWWTDRGNPALISNAITVTAPHILKVSRIGAETLLVTDGTNVHSYTGGIGSGAVLSSTVDLGSNFTSCCIAPAIRTNYIGTFTETAEEARVFEWDGASTNYTQSYPVGAKCVLAIETYQDTPVIVTERGEIKMFNNAGFTTIAKFPFTDSMNIDESTFTGFIEPQNVSRPIHPKGIKVVGDFIYIYVNFVNALTGSLIDEKTPSGLWVLDMKTYSLSHIGSQDNESIFKSSTPIMVINDPNTRIFLAGSKENGGTYPEGIWIEDLDSTSTNTGYFVTKEYESNSVQDTYDEIIVKALLGQDDEIVVKYRMRNDVLLPIIAERVTWLDEYTFNTTVNLSHLETRFNASEENRDEVEIFLGQGAGNLAHITNITSSATVYSVTIDTPLGAEAEMSDVIVDNWSLVPKEMTQTDGEYLRFGIGKTGTWAQFKVGISGKAGYPEVRQFLVKTNNKEGL